ncbi:MAG: Hsp20/alpha crystallin family protein [Chloroflexi bacterium]|nr:MAG: Hsp20/alpha crystallin family protein [Chloroflexota bacterium]
MMIERWRPIWALRPWRPFAELEEVERLFDHILGRTFLPLTWRQLNGDGWTPAIELLEKEDKFIARVDLPGMKVEDIEVSVVDNTLTIKGERKADQEVKEEDYYCSERCYGSFLRSITLPTPVEREHVEATYENGVLEVTLPKAAEIKPKKVEISVK